MSDLAAAPQPYQVRLPSLCSELTWKVVVAFCTQACALSATPSQGFRLVQQCVLSELSNGAWGLCVPRFKGALQVLYCFCVSRSCFREAAAAQLAFARRLRDENPQQLDLIICALSELPILCFTALVSAVVTVPSAPSLHNPLPREAYCNRLWSIHAL